MADYDFQITSGIYAGMYKIDPKDITASDVGDLLSQGGPDLDAIFTGKGSQGTRAIAALVWVVRRRGNRGLAFRAVADHINFDNIDMAPDNGETEADGPVLPDPSSSADASPG